MTPEPLLPLYDAEHAIAEIKRLIRVGDPVAALALSNQAVTQARRAGDPATLARTLDCLVRGHFYSGGLEQALRTSAEAIALWKQVGDLRGKAEALAMHAVLLSELGELQATMRCAQEAVRSSQQLDDLTTQAWAASALSLAHRVCKQWDEARVQARRAIELAERSGDQDMLARLLGNFGIVLIYRALEHEAAADAVGARKAYEEAIPSVRQSVALYRSLTLPHLVALSLSNVAHCACKLGLHEEAQEALDGYMDFVRRQGHPMREAYGSMLLGMLQSERNELEAAVATLEEAVEKSLRCRAPKFVMVSHQRLAEVWERRGDGERALHHMRRYHAHFKRVEAETETRRAHLMAVEFEVEQARLLEENERLRAENLLAVNQRLMAEADQLSRDAVRDPLTGLYNRRRLDAVLLEEKARGSRFYCMALVDIDHFKAINDRHSHLVGDRVLQKVAEVLRTAARADDVVVRFGGEEFAIVLRDTDAPTALHAAERLRAALEWADWSVIDRDLRVTASVGVATRREVLNEEALLALADRRLYAAKLAGRNRVVGANAAPSSP